nr:unnamed protein product [Callosobruchus chinensis]
MLKHLLKRLQEYKRPRDTANCKATKTSDAALRLAVTRDLFQLSLEQSLQISFCYHASPDAQMNVLLRCYKDLPCTKGQVLMLASKIDEQPIINKNQIGERLPDIINSSINDRMVRQTKRQTVKL